ncbi:MAG: hypothetical protein KBC69_03150 [Candidatus Magasanikbacteria bacterium]|nr:hypothetical protein [Candidatus Magasanikbacteria bacterium]
MPPIEWMPGIEPLPQGEIKRINDDERNRETPPPTQPTVEIHIPATPSEPTPQKPQDGGWRRGVEEIEI